MATNCVVYIATKMTGCDKAELVARANKVCEIFRCYGLTPISPVIEEKVEDKTGELINADKAALQGFWKRDKEIIINEAHVLFWDHAEQKSMGVEREYGLTRYCLWKPCVTYLPPGIAMGVAEWEDDNIFDSVNKAAEYIAANWGTRRQRVTWRVRMLARTLPTWVYRQVIAWR